MSPFTKLLNPSTYASCGWDLLADTDSRLYWVAFFKRHINTILTLGTAAAIARGESGPSATARANACGQDFFATFDAYLQNPTTPPLPVNPPGPVTILTLDQWRDQLLRRHHFVDAFIDLKIRENERALPLLPTICQELDALTHDPAAQLLTVIQGVFAGNIFDMGAEATAKAFLHNSPNFHTTRSTLPPRPWIIDTFDALQDRLLPHPHDFPSPQSPRIAIRGSPSLPHHKAILFIDNAGSDFLLGVLPLARYLAQRGTQVVLAANERPSLNDMTIHDVRAWWPRILQTEPSLAPLPISMVSTGTGEPLIDLSQVSDDLNTAATDADLVILEGMGRGVESNLDAQFSCDSLNLAMLKDTAVAKRVGGKVFDVICSYRPAPV